MPPAPPARLETDGPIAGADEAGRGCLAGPVVAAAVILPPHCRLPGLTDSKRLNPEARAALYPLIRQRSVAWGIGVAWPPEIDQHNILWASLRAMARAVNLLRVAPARVLVDGNTTIPVDLLPPGLAQEAVVDGDLKIRCISAASVLAKVFRDGLMARLDRRYPGYGLAAHKGYATAEHREALRRLGPCRIHRRSFRHVRPCDPGPEPLCLPGL